MLKLERDIRKNFDVYYSNRPRDANYNPKGLEKNLDLIPYKQLTDRQKCMLDQDRILYFDWLLAQGEKTVMTRRTRLRIKCVDETYNECEQSIPFETRNNWIESRIEIKFKYFD